VNVVEIILLVVLFYILPCIGLAKLFEKAGRAAWEAFIPLYNWFIMIKISGKPNWWFILLLIPGINILFLIGVHLDFVKSYGKFGLGEQILSVLFPFVFLPKWGYDPLTKYIGPSATADFKESHKKYLKKSSGREWTEAIIFAVVAATLIRTFFIEAYTIPTPSMERSLLVWRFPFCEQG
jgi:signal peptidase I